METKNNLKESWERLKEAVTAGHVESVALDDLYEFVEDTLFDPIYCPSCGSCGDTDCHPNPSICLYVDVHQRQADTLAKREDILYAAVELIEDLSNSWNSNPEASVEHSMAFALGKISGIAEKTLKEVDDLEDL